MLLTVGDGKIGFRNNGHLGVDVYINATEGNVNIGKNVAIGLKTKNMYS